MDPTERVLRVRAKAMMRKRARSVRASVPTGALDERSARLRERLADVPEFVRGSSYGMFWPIERNKEVDLRPLVELLLATGKRVAFPRILDRGGPLSFAWVERSADLDERGFGFAEPSPELEEASELDVVIVPALMLDSRGHRLGYGGGYYDRTLPRLCPPGVAIGVGFDFQLAPEIPELDGDVPVDVIVTDARTVTLGAQATSNTTSSGSPRWRRE